MFEQSDKIAAFKKKIALWVHHISKDRLVLIDMFPNAWHETAGHSGQKRPEKNSNSASH